MDKEYIKMCDCPEIQKLWDKSDGDFVYQDGGVDAIKSRWWYQRPYFYTDMVGESDCWDEVGSEAIWLPRQDQLQEMVAGVLEGLQAKVQDVANWIHPRRADMPDYPKQCESMEQLWLAYVMKERFGKTWSGSEWLDKS